MSFIGRRVIGHALTVGLALQIPLLVSAATREETSIPAASQSGQGFVHTEIIDIETLRTEAIDLEVQGLSQKLGDSVGSSEPLTRAAKLFERLGTVEGGRTQGYWRASRAMWMVGELKPLDDKDGRLLKFEAALALADRGLEANPECAECMLWKFVSMGRIFTTTSPFRAAGKAKAMAALLDDAIALNPQYRDSDHNSTLGNLHYSSAIFYRILPDWFWLRWVLGVKGDKNRSLAHSRKALSLHPSRVDYQIELCTQLVCLGNSRNDPSKLKEGLSILNEAGRREPQNEDELREIQFARIISEQPRNACGYSGDGVIELDEKTAKKRKAM